jgi:hypothetical protein
MKCKCGHKKTEHSRLGCNHIVDKYELLVCSCRSYRPSEQLKRWSLIKGSFIHILELDGVQVAEFYENKNIAKIVVDALNKHRVG